MALADSLRGEVMMGKFGLLVVLVLVGCGDGPREGDRAPDLGPPECWAFTVQGSLFESLGSGEFQCHANTRMGGTRWESIECLVPEFSPLIWLGQSCGVELLDQVWDPDQSRIMLDGTLFSEGAFLPGVELPFRLDLVVDEPTGLLEGEGWSEFATLPITLAVRGGLLLEAACPALRYPPDNPCDARN